MSDNPFQFKRGAWGAGLLVTATLIAIVGLALRRQLATITSLPPTPSTRTTPQATTPLTLPSTLAAPAGATVVYECNPGVRTYSDTPCAAAVRLKVLDPAAQNTYHADASTQLLPEQNPATELSARPSVSMPSGLSRIDTSRNAFEAKRALCADIERQIDAINARMRAGYSSVEGEWFRRELNRLSDLRYNTRCFR